MAARTKAQNLPVSGSLRWTKMEASDAEQKATTKIATEARRVGSVFISKTNFMASRERGGRCDGTLLELRKGQGPLRMEWSAGTIDPRGIGLPNSKKGS
jgi:hypothetical protein